MIQRAIAGRWPRGANDPQSDTWEHDAPTLTPRHGLGAMALGDADRAIPGKRDQSLRAIYLLTRLIGIVVSCVMVLASFSKVASFWLSLTVAESPLQRGTLSISLHRCQYLCQARKLDNGLGA